VGFSFSFLGAGEEEEQYWKKLREGQKVEAGRRAAPGRRGLEGGQVSLAATKQPPRIVPLLTVIPWAHLGHTLGTP